jgi:hypothetical protein
VQLLAMRLVGRTQLLQMSASEPWLSGMHGPLFRVQVLLVYSRLKPSRLKAAVRFDSHQRLLCFLVFFVNFELCDWENSTEATMNVLKKYWGISAISLAAALFLVGVFFVRDPASAGQFASNYFAAGEFARGVFASGEFAAGIFAAGTFAVGVFSIGIFSIGIFSAGLFSIGLYGIGLFVLARYRKPLRIESGSEGQAGEN